jgi:monoamine oxidase
MFSVYNLDRLADTPALIAFVSCRNALNIEKMSDHDASSMIHRAMTDWLGREAPLPDAVHKTRWSQDPCSRGIHSHIIAGKSKPGAQKTIGQSTSQRRR